MKLKRYFAYGSNMNHEQMMLRCPSAVFLKRARLENHKFVYDGYSKKRNGAVANIIKSSGDIAWGGIFEINADNLKALDYYEGYPKAYDKKTIVVKDKENNSCRAIAYFRINQTAGRPHRDYRACVLKGAVDCSLGDEYVKNNL